MEASFWHLIALLKCFSSELFDIYEFLMKFITINIVTFSL